MECFIPTADGSKHLGAANLYGYAGASTDDQLRKLNELLLKAAFARMAAFNDVPYYLGMDLNMDPQTSMVTTAAKKDGLVYDLIEDWTPDTLQPLGTFKSGGVNHTMDISKGSGVTRIDTILGNRVASHAASGICYQWGLSSGMDHAGLTVITDERAYNEKVSKYIQPANITLPSTHPMHRKRNDKIKLEVEKRFSVLWSTDYETPFNAALECDDFEAASTLWHQACESTLLFMFNRMQGQAYRETATRDHSATPDG
jgi:hypothetical protein